MEHDEDDDDQGKETTANGDHIEVGQGILSAVERG